MTQKYLNGELVDLTPAEQAEYDALNAPAALLAAAKAARKAAVTARSRERQAAGTTVAGNFVPTHAEARNLYEQAWADVQDGATSVTLQKADGAWVVLTAVQFQAVARAVRALVRNCIATERTHHEAIDALASAQDVNAYDVTTGWPA